MARLSQRAINNIVIFAMLIMIAMFNFDMLLPQRQAADALPLIPQGASIVRVESRNFTIKRIDDDYQLMQGRLAFSPNDVVQFWQSQSVELIGRPSAESSSSTSVRIWLDEGAEGHLFKVYQLSRTQAVIEYNGNWFDLSASSANKLLGQEE